MYRIRKIRTIEIPLLEDFLYEAIFIPEGVPPPPKSIINNEDLQVYVKNFGLLPDDKCLVAEVDGKIVGAIWSRIMEDYGHEWSTLDIHLLQGIPSITSILSQPFWCRRYKWSLRWLSLLAAASLGLSQCNNARWQQSCWRRFRSLHWGQDK